MGWGGGCERGGAGKIGDVSYAQVPSSRLRKTVIRVDEEEKKMKINTSYMSRSPPKYSKISMPYASHRFSKAEV